MVILTFPITSDAENGDTNYCLWCTYNEQDSFVTSVALTNVNNDQNDD